MVPMPCRSLATKPCHIGRPVLQRRVFDHGQQQHHQPGRLHAAFYFLGANDGADAALLVDAVAFRELEIVDGRPPPSSLRSLSTGLAKAS